MKSDDLQILETNAKHFNKKNGSVGYQFVTLQTIKMGRGGKEGHSPETTLHQLLPSFPQSSICKHFKTERVKRRTIDRLKPWKLLFFINSYKLILKKGENVRCVYQCRRYTAEFESTSNPISSCFPLGVGKPQTRGRAFHVLHTQLFPWFLGDPRITVLASQMSPCFLCGNII